MKLKDADIIAIFGGSGSGKSHLARRLVSKDKRLMIFDVMGEHSDHCTSCTTLKSVVALVQSKNFRVSFVPRFDRLDQDFAAFCKIAYTVGQLRLYVEELNTVTKPSYAPPMWRDVSSRGRHRGLHIIGVSQRPAGVDKDFIANATQLMAGVLTYKRDMQALQPILGDRALTLCNMKKRQFIGWRG